MTRKIVIVAGVFILAICLISGGCQPQNQTSSLKTWKDLIELLPEQKQGSEVQKTPEIEVEPTPPPIPEETMIVNLYFSNAAGKELVLESREIVKAEGIGRVTLGELFKGPMDPAYAAVVPPGTRLLDINVKPEGVCIVDLSSEARLVENAEQEKLMVFAIANTLGQFASVQEVSFMVGGEKVSKIGGFMDLSTPVAPDYSR